jgi:hypothetical protein
MWHVERFASGLRAARKRTGGRVIGRQPSCCAAVILMPPTV